MCRWRKPHLSCSSTCYTDQSSYLLTVGCLCLCFWPLKEMERHWREREKKGTFTLLHKIHCLWVQERGFSILSDFYLSDAWDRFPGHSAEFQDAPGSTRFSGTGAGEEQGRKGDLVWLLPQPFTRSDVGQGNKISLMLSIVICKIVRTTHGVVVRI